ncbi:uncharacterized protein BDCG_02190 [Blastomyces dermatitidis ER-3]|nr:uncharacterized protein BDCG_02190 [Blastomyces dermatitidis ER-3]EEQ87070.1 hypothetical protein BDCG_02190 [Blastomyces dermatitidis ER-3]EQL33210.1 hypothetical protein BDFG_04654 [Blastomyces dermatitidis ATCC 26199]
MGEIVIPPSYLVAVRQLQNKYDEAIAAGRIRPVLFPHSFAPLIILVLSLLVKTPRNGHFTIIKYLSFGSVICSGLLNIIQSRMYLGGNGCVVGIASFWYIMLSASLLVLNDPQGRFKRIERTTIFSHNRENCSSCSENHVLATISNRSLEDKEIGNTKFRLSRTTKKALQPGIKCNHRPDAGSEMYILRWQAYPNTFPHRLVWVWDLIVNMRGPGWNWRISTIPLLPKSVSSHLDPLSRGVRKPEIMNLSNTKSAAKSALFQMTWSYLGLDALKVIMMLDPYFWGVVSSPPPFPLDSFGTFGNITTQAYRLLLSVMGVICAVECTAWAISLLSLSISLWVPFARTWTSIPIEAPWLYPKIFGPCFSSLLDHGLIGFWSKWWHQVFRFNFLQPSNWIYAHLPQRLQKPFVRQSLQLYIAFGLSGLLHAAGSYTQLAPTKPFPNLFLFFFLQAPAIMFQDFVAKNIVTLLPFNPPRWLRRSTNFIFVVTWAFLIGPLGADDFAKGGIWLVEPVPLSPIRGLGFGAEGQGWWCWKGQAFKQWRGEKWWDVGIRIM